jgi:hypothetical protein
MSQLLKAKSDPLLFWLTIVLLLLVVAVVGLIVDDARVRARIKSSEQALQSEIASEGVIDNPAALNNLAWAVSTSSDANIRDGALGVELAKRACELTHYTDTRIVGTLAAAYAEAGQFDKAISTEQKACALATAQGDTKLFLRNQTLLTFYQAHRPFHEPANRVTDHTSPLASASRIRQPLNPDNLLFVVMGDSLSATTTPSGFPNDNPIMGTNTWPTFCFASPLTNSIFYGTHFTGSNFVNWATPGYGVLYQLQNYTNNDSPLSPGHLPHKTGQQRYFVFMCGVNDLPGLPLSVIETNLLLVWQSARADGYKVIASTVTGSCDQDNNWYSPDSRFYTKLLALNSWIVSQANQWNGLVDAYAVVSPDNIWGVHWDATGCQQFAIAFEIVLAPP